MPYKYKLTSMIISSFIGSGLIAYFQHKGSYTHGVAILMALSLGIIVGIIHALFFPSSETATDDK